MATVVTGPVAVCVLALSALTASAVLAAVRQWSLASASAQLWVGAIFYVRINGGKDAVQIRSKGKLKDSGFNRLEYREFPLVINGDDVNPLAVKMRFEELSEKRSVNTATKYGMDDCQRGAKRLWAQYCHTEQGMELWGQAKMTGRTDLL